VKYWPASIDVVRQLRAAHLTKQAAAAAASQARYERRARRDPRSGSGHDRRGQGRNVGGVRGAVGPRLQLQPLHRTRWPIRRCSAAIDTLRAKGLTISSG